MSDSYLGFRKFTRAWLEYQGTPPTPIPTLANPESIELNPGIETGELMSTSCTGETTIDFTYPESIKGELNMSFPASCPELDSLITGRKFATTTNREEFVLIEATAIATTVAAKTTGQYGAQIAAQTAATSKARAYYLDPVTKLHKNLTIVDSAPGPTDEVVIGAGGLLTLSANLVAGNFTIYVWVPATFPAGTIMTATPVGLISVYLVGIHFDNTTKLAKARNCSIIYGATYNNEAKRDIKLRILRDPSDGTGLGWTMTNLNVQMAC